MALVGVFMLLMNWVNYIFVQQVARYEGEIILLYAEFWLSALFTLYSENFFYSSLKLFGSIRIAYGFIARLASDYNEKGWNIYQPLFFNFIIYFLINHEFL